ncbi:outer membrane protein assembly factor BamB family protein [Nocardiopsis terrae]
MIREMSEGVVVLLEGGAFALSGETGEELWSYYDRGEQLAGNVTDDGEYVVLHDEDSDRTVLLETDTGRIAHEYGLDLSEYEYTKTTSPHDLDAALGGITGETWVVRWENSVSSYDLDTGEPVWAAADVPSCSDVGQVDSLTVQKEVVVAATTCFEHPEDKETVAWTVGWDFTSELVGLDPGTGEELWRVEHSIGRMPYDSLGRTVTSRPGGLVYIDFNDPSLPLRYSLLDIEAREATHLETRSLLWTSQDGARLGLWDTETGDYLIQDRSGDVERTLERDGVSMSDDMVADGHRVGLEGGVLYLAEWTEDGSVPEGFARFEGFDSSTTFVWDRAESISVSNALSVPGGVAVAYRADGEPGVMGLR